MRTDAHSLKPEVQKNFPNLTFDQIWTLVKLSKMVRLRCRNNTAFNNAFNTMFEGIAEFRNVQKTRSDNTTYSGLSIKMNGKEQDIGEEED